VCFESRSARPAFSDWDFGSMEDSKRIDPKDESIFITEVSDETLEAAACSGPQNGNYFTIAMCTGQAECPF
jgi:hypothetical protein